MKYFQYNIEKKENSDDEEEDDDDDDFGGGPAKKDVPDDPVLRESIFLYPEYLEIVIRVYRHTYTFEVRFFQSL